MSAQLGFDFEPPKVTKTAGECAGTCGRVLELVECEAVSGGGVRYPRGGMFDGLGRPWCWDCYARRPKGV